MKRTLALALCCALLCCGFASGASAETGSVGIGGGTATTVTIDLRGATADVALAQDSISKDLSAADILSAAGAGGSLIAAVNGGFFNAYYEKSPEEGYGKAPRCQVNLIKNGAVINGGAGDQTAVYLGFTADGRALIDEVGVTLFVEYGDKSVPTWGVNYYYPEPNSLLLFTPEAGADLPVPASARVAKIVNGKVAEILDSGKMVCAPGTYYFVCGRELYHHLPAVGTEVSFRTEFDKSAWSGVTTAVSCGPWLLHDGKNVFSENSRFGYLADQKVSETAVAGRTFAAILADGRLMLGTCAASPRQITERLVSLGATDAMLLDGGASSMLWANGKMLTKAGRKLNNVIVLYGGATSETPPAPAEEPAVVPTSQNLTVDGVKKNTEIYNIDGSNYFKLRDMAALLDGTGSQFSVAWDAASGTIAVKTGEAYTPSGGELTGPSAAEMARKAAEAVPSAQKLTVNGAGAELTAYNIGGNNFFKLRDLGEKLNFGVDWDGATSTMVVTSKG